jgi:NAD(P)-dependent dehydrogenase (short-subunit alcohol dehydrogenase family)
MSRVVIVTGGACGIGLAAVRRLEVLEVFLTSFDPHENEGHVGDKVRQSPKDHAWQRRATGAVKLLAVIPTLP